MAAPNCWRCLARPSQTRLLSFPTISTPATTLPASVSLFSTSTALAATLPGKKKEATGKGHIRAGKRLTLGKKKRKPAEKGRPVAPGERKAFRKRIQLSNDNALEVPGLLELSKEVISDPESVGKVVRLPGTLVDQLRTIEVFKPTQNWSLFRSPHMLIRKETAELAKQIQDAVDKKQTLRTVITGSKGSGKSILDLQVLSMGLLNDYCVIHIPEVQDLTTAHVDYSAIPDSNLYAQPTATIKLMQAILKANPVLSQYKVEGDYLYLPVNISRSMTLAQMLTATKDPEFAWPVFKAFWQELIRPGRPPVMFTLDGLAHMMRMSDYRSPSFEIIHSHDMALVGLFADSLAGRVQFPNGAAIIGTTSQSNCPIIPSLVKALEQATARTKGLPVPPRDPYCKDKDERVYECLKDVKVQEVQGLSKSEARSLMEYWAASGMLRTTVNEYSVSDKWTMAGGGIVAEMERAALYDNRMAM
ncbi:mitochondrial ribosomal death-associated protein 3-domain-containing protein [Microdochium trichocladiopsis]|uniref:Small ribosomal subunit protein mS29 n=1 Tax=Microdochium trichocladiopsis TaxID=1682393 RepID=A0A9P8YAQ2_9PEZI|nr:mitochondrial ribosomal death-associated protein 3-domain-containing protein [Microdochium trichocladiopsis]KAH7034807.1 mitochondrial ribosomal death-associated protein 3-domain-containing protein [Microdochium trichocladiopsis]